MTGIPGKKNIGGERSGGHPKGIQPLNTNLPPMPHMHPVTSDSSNHLYATRRIWIKRINGTPTTLIIHRNDIIDDLKSAVTNKFPNTLGRYFDPADLLIKMDLSTRSPANANSQNTPKRMAASSTGKLSPDPTHKSPITSPFPQTQAKNTPPSNYLYINLDPDQNVWNLLDYYYPNGISLSEALVVDTPTLAPYVDQQYHDQQAQNPPPQHPQPQHPQPQHPQHPQPQHPQPRRHQYTPHVPQANTSQQHLTVQNNNNASTRLESPQESATDTPVYFQPKPQNLFLNKSLANNTTSIDQLVKDRSVSPSTVNTRASPGPMHRRAHSNPPQSPVNYSVGMSQSNNSSAANNQAILLLPKNFSLASGGSNSENNGSGIDRDKKRLSLDSGYARKNRGSFSLKPSTSGTNITNIGMSLTSPTSGSTSYLSIPEKQDKNDVNDDKKDKKSTKVETSTEDSRKVAKSTPVDTKTEKSNETQSNNKAVSKPLFKTLGGKGSDNKSNNANGHVKSKSATERVLPSISVLVVEDNAINQAILGAFLRKHKIHYQIAKNGQEAIDKWRKGGFHLVLMDIQLPVKSGIEATKEIRHLEKINRIGVFAQNEILVNNHYPNQSELKEDEVLDLNVFRSPVIIVALTASSNSSSDKQKALMAGCNDYLTKPVNLVWLQNKITEWGCMQALIDFDGWHKRGGNGETEKKTIKSFVPSQHNEKGMILGGVAPREIKS
ncbi:oxidative stress response two-component system protein Ssk1p [[Candida] anglica]|uniref:Oxidative stress response two-component system protein Ssk1p n=1 Tax=[Candida] anglica TaxID=148631 RepID=A0ABP0EFI7_9ASCO